MSVGWMSSCTSVNVYTEARYAQFATYLAELRSLRPDEIRLQGGPFAVSMEARTRTRRDTDAGGPEVGAQRCRLPTAAGLAQSRFHTTRLGVEP